MSNKINIYKIKESIGFSLGFDNVQKIGNISQLDKFSNIIYEGEIAGSAESSHKKLKVYKVHFLYGDDKIQELIVDFLENDEQAYKKDNLVDIVTYIQNVFKNQILSQIVAELLGDLGEGLFISTLEKNKIDWCDAYHVEENSLFDFYFDGVYIDVKATTENKKQIIVQQDQLPTDRQNVTICVAQIPKKQGGKNIINLLMSIKTDNQLIKQKIKK
ncbi:hypothetical protein FACS1894166_02650 [Bacilli bacterium]|nr:hypothetical protein FACS1894166_02650 [Bacilli bacterium]